MIEIGIDSEILDTIRSGQKVVEGRLRRGKFLDVKGGDAISIREDFYEGGNIIRSAHGSLKLIVDEVREFGSFQAMLEKAGYSKVIPGTQSLAEAVEKYRLFYSESDEREFGVLGIYFHVSKS